MNKYFLRALVLFLVSAPFGVRAQQPDSVTVDRKLLEELQTALEDRIDEKEKEKAEKAKRAEDKDSTAYQSKYHEIAQFSLFPPASNLGGKAGETTVNFGFNVFGYAQNLEGIDFSLLASTYNGYVNGAQISGLSNVAKKGVKGAQFSAVNYAGNVKGAQWGAVNVSDGRMKGAQVGLVNVAKKAKGVQVGLINVVDSLDGVPIGLINVVKQNGINVIEFSYSDALNYNLAYKLGHEHFYTILTVGGSRYSGDYTRYGFGAGLGGHINLGRVNSIVLEVTSTHVNEDEFFTYDLNLLNKGKIGLEFRVLPWMSFTAAPTFNYFVSRLHGTGESNNYPEMTPNKYIYEDTDYHGYTHKFWVGYEFGVRLGRNR